MTDKTSAHSLSANSQTETVPVPKNPTRAELKSSLDQAEFPAASRMSKEIFGENPKHAEEEE